MKSRFYSYVRCLLSQGAIAEQKVFVVNDEEYIANLLSLYLRKVRFDVETFHDARSALQRASNCLPDVLVGDITMAGMDGITLAETLRERNPDCKVILISGSPDWKARGDSQSGRLGDFTLLLKPFSMRQLLCLITSKLEPRLRPTA
jgi:DNA-binding NtrC family response regulator